MLRMLDRNKITTGIERRTRSGAGWLAVRSVFAGVALLFAAVPPAGAAPVSLKDSTVEVQFWPEGEPETTVIIVGTVLPPGTHLPTVVQLPLPEGASVFWAGEIMSDIAEEDIQREPTVVDAEGGKAVEFSVEETLSVQYEAVYDVLRSDLGLRKATLAWVQTVPSAMVSVAVRLPSYASAVRLDPDAPGQPQANQDGEMLYTLKPIEVALGDEFDVDVEYRTTPAELDDKGSPLVPILIGLFAVAVIVLVVVLVIEARHRSATRV